MEYKISLSDYLDIADSARKDRRVTELHADILDLIFDGLDTIYKDEDMQDLKDNELNSTDKNA